MAATADDYLHTFADEDDTASLTGERIVELADGTRSIEAIARQIQSEFEGCALEQAMADVETFVSLLVDRQILVLQEQPVGSNPLGPKHQEQRP
jgi:pyrroloquinoline quinone biosynthesis protein D